MDGALALRRRLDGRSPALCGPGRPAGVRLGDRPRPHDLWPLAEAADTLELDTYEVTETAHVLTDREGIHALTAWRAYNRGAAVEARIKELRQLSVGQTAVDDRDGNALLWSLGTLAYQLLHTIRSQTLTGSWRRAQPDRLRAWLFRLPGRFTRHARKTYLQLRREEPLRGRLLLALRRIARLRGPPLPAAG